MAYSKKPNDIPTTPNLVYAKDGWKNWPDWLGTDTRSPGEIAWRPFKKARAFARSLGLKSGTEWVAFGKTDKMPADIPTAPYRIYAKDGWTNWPDWLGTNTAPRGGWRPFVEARNYVRRLGIKTSTEWLAFVKTDKKPRDIPAYPNATYAKDGWAGFRDWLGHRTSVAAARAQHKSLVTG